MQLEDGGAVEGAALGQVPHGAVNEGETAVEGLAERPLLVRDDLIDERASLDELGIGRAHEVADCACHSDHERPVHPKLHAVSNRPPHDPTKHVPAPLV